MAHSSKSSNRIIFVTAWAGVGKTTTGDYLSSYCKFHHVDGDEDMRRRHMPECASATDGLLKAFTDYWFKNAVAPAELWHPYFELLCAKCLEAAKEHDDIVVSFSVYRREARDFIRERLGVLGLVFLKLECDVDVVVKGAQKRLANFMKIQGKSVEDYWNGPSRFAGVCFREKYGEYNFESFKKMQLEYYLSGMEPFAVDEHDAIIVDVSERDASVFDRIHAALGLPPRIGDIDMDMVHSLQEARWKEKLSRDQEASFKSRIRSREAASCCCVQS